MFRKSKTITFQFQFAAAAVSLAVFFLSTPTFAGLFDDAVSGKATVSDSTSTAAETSEPATADAAADSPAEGSTPTTAGEGGAVETTTTLPAPAQPESTAVERIIESSGLGFDLNGHIRGDLFIGKMPDYSRVEIKNGYGELALKLKVSKAPYGDAFADVRFQAGYLNDQHYLGQPTDTAASGEDLSEFDARVKLREAYVNVYAGSHFDLKFGQQIIVWGRADGTNPTNNLTPIDLRVRSADEDDRRLGNLAVRANLNFSPIRIEGVWVPFYSPSYLPRIPIQPVEQEQADGSVDERSVEFVAPDYPTKDITKGTYAGKIHLLLPQVEMSLSYLYGYSLQPGIALSTVLGNMEADQILVRRVAFQHHVAGFDFATTIAGSVGLRGEVAFKYPVDFKDELPYENDDFRNQVAIPNPEVFYVLGLDKEFGNVMLLGQYIGKTVIKWQEIQPPSLPEFAQLIDKNRLIQGQTEQFQHAISARVEWKTLHDTLSLSAFGMVNISTLEWLIYPKIAYSITDGMSVTVGGEIYQGPSDSLFGYIEEILTAGYTELRIAF